MHDYQLERLNTRSFEQLVQALGLEVIGKQLMIFGDGPDGGREATFEGPTKYPDGKKQWDGYGIVQAKFRQQPDSQARKNTDWAIAQLNAEFKKLSPRGIKKAPENQRERICPEYYIFATNLRLSSVVKKGGKDRVKAVFDGFKKSHGLKDYAIWDGDQIHRFLDCQPGIRTTYAAWLLPGDVLSEMMNFLDLEKTDFPSTIRRYLESELLDDQYAKLSQGGYTDANAIPLSKVFLDLPIELPSGRATHQEDYSFNEGEDNRGKRSTKEGRATFLELFFEEGRKVLKPSANPRQVAESIRLQGEAGRIVLIGGPGQGKTTIGQFACQMLRAALLNATCATYSPEVKNALAHIADQSQELPKTHVLRYPLRVDLKRLAEALAGDGDFGANSVLDYLVKHISKRTDTELGIKEFRKWLKSYPWLLVLDGLDEVPASSNRTKLMSAIRDFVSVEAHQQDADLLILATTRPQGYSDEFDPGLYWHLQIAPLNATEALQYGVKLAEARHRGLKSRIEDLTKSLRRATTNTATVRLMESPLQVTIMLALIEGGGEPPEQRWKLFHDYYDVIYRREKERGTPFSVLLGKYEPDIHWLHHRAGWILQRRNATAGQTAARLTHQEFEEMVEDRLLKRGHIDSNQRIELVNQIRIAATDRLVFLVGNTANEIGFEIRSLQEFMAAEHCFDGSESCVQITIRAIAPHSYWQNVFLFVAGRIFFEKESLIDSLIVVCEQLNETLTDQAQGYIRAGSRLALSMLKDGVARNQPENSRVLSRCAAHLLDSKDQDDAIGFLWVFDSETSNVWREELSQRLRNRVSLQILSWRLCIHLVVAGNDWATRIMLREFPWHDSESSKLVAQMIVNHDLESKSLVSFLLKHLYILPATIWLHLLWSEKLPEALSIEPLRQLKLIYSRSNVVELLDDNGQKTDNGINQIPELNNMWESVRIPLGDVEEVHSTWRIYHAISEFAREYSPAGLVKQLQIIDALDPQFELSRNHRFPWQINACFAAKRSGILLPEILSAVTSGAIGNTDDWTRWDTLNKEGIKLSQLGYPDGLFSVSDNHLGSIYESVGWVHSRSNRAFEFAATLVEALPYLRPESDIAKCLVNLCCFGLNSLDQKWSPTDADTVEQLIKHCQDSKIPMSRAIIVSLVRSSLTTQEKIGLLSLVGTRVDSNSWLDEWNQNSVKINESCNQIVAALDESDNWLEVLGALSFIPPLSYIQAIPSSLIERCHQSDTPYRQAAIALQTNSLEWNIDGEKVAADVLSIHAKYPHHLYDLLQFIDLQGKSGAYLESFLLALLEISETGFDFHFKANVASLLAKLVDRRPAPDTLPDPSISKLPSGGSSG